MANILSDSREPHSTEAEEAVIGAMMIDADAVLKAREVGLQPADFWNPTWGIVYEAMLGITNTLQHVDTVTVQNALKAKTNGDGRTILEHIGGMGPIIALIEKTPSSVYAAHYAGIIRDHARRRELIRAAGEIANLAYEHEGEIDALYNEVGWVFTQAVNTVTGHTHLQGGDETMMEYLVNQQRRADELAKNPYAQIKTGLLDLDRMLGNIAPGQLHAVVARSGVGKTMYCEQLAEHNAAHFHRIAYYHLEQQGQDMLDRMIARWGGIPLYELRNGYQGREVGEAIDRIREWCANITYVHCPGRGADWIASDIQRLHAKKGLGLVVVDYLQKIALPEHNKNGLNSAQLWGAVVERIKTCAEVTGLPIVMGSQVRKSEFGNRSEAPTLEDVRNTGELEEKANQVVILHRKTTDGQKLVRGSTERVMARVEKNTGGPTGKVEIGHVVGHYRLVSVAQEEDIEEMPR